MTDTNNFDPVALVSEFNVAFEVVPSVDLWLKLVREEENELLEAMALNITDDTIESLTNVLKEACDLLYVISGLGLVMEPNGLVFDDGRGQDLGTLLGGILNVFGEATFEEAFRRVHTSNMSKLGEDGRPVRREDGKVLKGPNYAPPVLNDLVLPIYTASRRDPSYLVRP